MWWTCEGGALLHGAANIERRERKAQHRRMRNDKSVAATKRKLSIVTPECVEQRKLSIIRCSGRCDGRLLVRNTASFERLVRRNWLSSAAGSEVILKLSKARWL